MIGFIVNAFNFILYQPLFNALVLLYLYLPGRNFGIAIIVLTILIKLILYPLGTKGVKAQKTLQDIQPRMKEIQEKFKNDKEKQSRAMLELYKKEKINPLSGCLPLLIQLPILIGLYRVFWRGFAAEQFQYLYSFVPHPGVIATTFLGFIDLASGATKIITENGAQHSIWLWPNVILILLVGALQFIQTKMLTPPQKNVPTDKSNLSSVMQKQMLYFFPIITVFILWRLPSAIALYWLTITVFTIFQQYVTLKKNGPREIKQN